MDEETTQALSGATRCGYVAIVGRPNVGKSTLLNYLLGQKISITSRKPQTTRHQVVGIKTEGTDQLIFVDTPGMHLEQGKAINRFMNRAANTALAGVDLVLFVVDRNRWTEEDDLVFTAVTQCDAPVALVINKVDLLEEPGVLLPYVERFLAKNSFVGVFPISALRNKQIDVLEAFVCQQMPEAAHFFPDDQVTDRSERFLASELIREKIVRQLGDELPYSTAVEIEAFKQEGKVLYINGLIFVEREGQKKILIGEGGSRLRSIGTEARKDMEKAFDSKVMLRLWVKVKSGWSDDIRALRSLGYEDR